MTLMRLLCFLMTVSGGALLSYTTWRYYCLLRYSRAESYVKFSHRHNLEFLTLLVLIFFIFGFVVGAIDMLMRAVEPIFMFVVVVFFVGAIFIFAMVQVQISLVASLRGKTMEVMLAFVNSIEMKDAYTQGHSWHVYHLVQLFYQHLPQETQDALSEPKLLDAALLHDIGKIGISNEILNQKGKLHDEAWQAIKTHPAIGRKMLENTCFSEIGDWVCYHHERMDGTGYHQLPGDEIPLASRIIAIADAYSAITTSREYRPKRSHEAALAILRETAGTQFDAELVACFCVIDKTALDALNELVWQGDRAESQNSGSVAKEERNGKEPGDICTFGGC